MNLKTPKKTIVCIISFPSSIGHSWSARERNLIASRHNCSGFLETFYAMRKVITPWSKTLGVLKYRYQQFLCHNRVLRSSSIGCNKTLTGVSGTFYSPNYPQKYPDGQYCSWRITVSPSQQIHLTFTYFSLQSENNTDGLYVYDGENATGEVLGVFYGGQPPPKEGIFASSNHMFIIFKSDNNVSYNGFSALYCQGKCPGKCCRVT